MLKISLKIINLVNHEVIDVHESHWIIIDLQRCKGVIQGKMEERDYIFGQ